MTIPNWQTPSGFLGTLTERQTVSFPLAATGTNISYSIVSGKLPVGLYLNTSTGLILGTPGSVSEIVETLFVVRAANNEGARDRTFTFDVSGPSSPVWVTIEGRLPVGLNGEYFCINKEYVDYQLRADTDILSPGNTLKYYIPDNLGSLPPGLKLSSDGRITGYVADNLDIDISASVAGGYDTETFDFYPYEHGIITQDQDDPGLNPKSINKIYQFYITVTDGIAESTRKFIIEVTDPDNLRADNSLMTIDEDIYDSSASYLLSPIWQNKYGNKLPKVQNLGSIRANKQQVIQLYDYDPYSLQGPAFYEWTTAKVNPDIKLYSDSHFNAALLPTKNLQGDSALYFKNAEIMPVKGMKIQLNEYVPNTDATIYTVTGVIKLSESSGYMNLDQPLAQRIPDSKIFYAGTPSEHPPGIALDSATGTLYGQIPYQPSYKNSYRFSVKVVKIDQSSGDTTLLDATGSDSGRIVGKIYSTSTTAIPADLPSIVSYTGQTGDIILVGQSYPIDPTKMRQWMDGTLRAYVFSPTYINVKQYEPNIEGTQITLELSNGITPAIGWVVKKGSFTSTIFEIEDSGGYWTVTLFDPVPANDNDPQVTWSLGDPSGSYWFYLGETVPSTQIYLLNILGDIPSNISFISTSSLGELTPGEISELCVKAVNSNTNYSVEFDLVQSELPTGLRLFADGSIQGKVTNTGQTYFDFTSTNTTSVTFDNGLTTVDRNWYFTIRASDVYRLSSVEQEFFITVYRDTTADFTRMFVKPFLDPKKRNEYKNFVTNTTIFDPALIYRSNDPEFGVQQQIRMILETGIEQININLYAEAMSQFFSRKKFYFGDIKVIKAQDSHGVDLYELVYIDIVDNQMIDTRTPAYAYSVANMQSQLESIELEDGSTIEVNERLQPKYMTTIDSETGVPLGFIKAVPLCYTIPGGSTKIISRLKNALDTRQFDFKDFNFETDRIIIETVKDSQATEWLLYPTDRR